jgi:hypothetical protein
MMRIYLVTYRPLIGTPAGFAAINEFNLPPYIDGSCRREPDFESDYPSISALCRGGNFAPHLRVGDIVIYMTKIGNYLHPQVKENHWRLTAILEVYKRFSSHADAANWYQEQHMKLPTNCMIPGNPPVPLEKSEGRHGTLPVLRPIPMRYKRHQLPMLDYDLLAWDKWYEERVKKWGVFLACTVQHRELWSPPIITRERMIDIFGDIPGTRTCRKVSAEEFRKLRCLCGA